MADVSPASIPIAFDRCDATAFEKYSQTVFSAVIGNTFKPLGGTADGGADGFVDADILEEGARPTVFFQASKELDTEGKIRRTVARLREVNREVKTLHYATSRHVKYIDKIEATLSETLAANIRIYDCSYFEQRANFNNDVKAAFRQYMQPYLAFLEQALAPSYPSSPTLKNARIVSAFLAQEVERRLGTTRTLQSVCDALILWALEGTDPDEGKFMSSQQIVEKVEGVIPTAKQFFRGSIENRLEALNTKQDGVRTINKYRKDGTYCLPYATRQALREHTLLDEALKASVSGSFQRRVLDASKETLGTNTVDALAAALHRILEAIFEKQGFYAARHFLDADPPNEDVLESRPVIEIAHDELKVSGFDPSKNPELLTVIKVALRGIVYNSTKDERAFCARLARTYVLLFIIRNTPEVIEYFNTMSKSFHLYVGSDLLVRAISEYYLPPED